MILSNTSGDRHAEIFDLLPWYVNSSLSEQDRRRVEAHLETCDQCTRELSFLAGLSRSVAEEEALLVSAERSLASVSERIDAVEAARQGRLGWPDVARIVAIKLTAGPTAWLRPALAVLALLTIAGGGWLWTDISEPDFRTLSAGETSPAAAATIRLVFDDGATVEKLQTLLTGLDVALVSGPSTYGVYTARIISSHDKARFAQVLNELRADPLVSFAEPIASSAADRSAP